MIKSLADGLDDHYAAQAEAGNTAAPGNRPWSKKIRSVALAVHPGQVKEATQDASRRGVSTEFTADGCPVFTDRDHRRRYMREYGFFDRDAGYGDAAPVRHKGRVPPPSRVRELAKRLAEKIRVRRESRR